MTASDDPLARARALDAADPLARFVEAFHPAADGPAGRTIYLAGHVLGQQPHATANAVTRELRRWREDLTAGPAERWNELAGLAADAVATVVGADPSSVFVGPPLVASVHQLVGDAMALRTNRPDIVASEGDPPAIREALAQRVEAVGGKLRLIGAGATPGMVSQALDESVGLVVLSHVDDESGSLLDLAAVTEAAQRSGAWTLWNCSQSAGTMPVGLAEVGVDLAVGSLGQHLFGGPGSPAWVHVRSELIDRLTPAERILIDEPAMLSLVAALPGAQLVAGADLDEVRAKSEQLTQLAMALADAWLAPHGLQLVTPRRAERRSAHITLRHPDAERMAATAAQRLGVIVDSVAPDLLRIGVSPLPLRFVDLVVAMRRLRDGVSSGQHTRI